MVYLQVEHTNDNDCDLFKFDDVFTAYRYIKTEELERWMLTDYPMGPFNDNDHTYIMSKRKFKPFMIKWKGITRGYRTTYTNGFDDIASALKRFNYLKSVGAEPVWMNDITEINIILDSRVENGTK